MFTATHYMPNRDNSTKRAQFQCCTLHVHPFFTCMLSLKFVHTTRGRWTVCFKVLRVWLFLFDSKWLQIIWEKNNKNRIESFTQKIVIEDDWQCKNEVAYAALCSHSLFLPFESNFIEIARLSVNICFEFSHWMRHTEMEKWHYWWFM